MMSSKEKIVMFDMDGTLTAPRGAVEPKVIQALKRLTKYARVGIITGSDYDYVLQQMSAAFDVGGVPVDRIDILPCNGTKKYVANQKREFELVSDVSMIQEIGEKDYRRLLHFCANSQAKIISCYPDIPFTGTFIQYRGSLLNWCPVGRSANNEERAKFVEVDKALDIRKSFMNELHELIQESDTRINITVALGGSTSLDIYPTGWDKTYGLTHYPDHDVWFVGDRCEKGGNDWHIYEALKKSNRSFHIHNPDDTIAVIDKIVNSFRA